MNINIYYWSLNANVILFVAYSSSAILILEWIANSHEMNSDSLKMVDEATRNAHGKYYLIFETRVGPVVRIDFLSDWFKSVILNHIGNHTTVEMKQKKNMFNILSLTKNEVCRATKYNSKKLNYHLITIY